ncbi:MAG: M23 family metallopeptidase [Gemmatimonadota bacterium]|nr:M23 family metallopeptidase [Gemmatimonadota bacterium]
MAANRRWTILFVPPGASSTRAIDIPARVLKWGAGLGAVAGVAALVFGVMTLTKSIDLTRLDRLERTNQLLGQELDITRTQLTELQDTLTAITHRDRQVRLLAGLEPMDADVQLAGIGGPVGEWSEREELLAEGTIGRAALDLRLDLDGLIRRANLIAGSFREAADSLTSHNDRLARTPSIMPTQGYLSSRFAKARIHPIFHEARAHEGIDISAPMGTPILAAASGLVMDVGTVAGYGKMVTVDHGYGLVTRYAHLSKALVRAGQRVKRGEEIAQVGNSGIATAPHLHYEVMVRGQQQDPLKFIFPETIVD